MALDPTKLPTITNAIRTKHNKPTWSTYDEYRTRVDQEIIAALGVGLDDLADSNIVWECYEADIPPAAAAAEVLGDDDLGSAFFSDNEISDIFSLD